MLAEGFLGAMRLVVSGDAEVYSAARVSVWVAGVSTVFAAALGVPAGLWLALGRFRWRGAAAAVLDSLLALPTVVVGLFLYSLLRKGGMLGPLGLLFSPWAMVLGQTVLAFPIVAALSRAAAEEVDRGVVETALCCGAAPMRAAATAAWEARFALLSAVVAAGGRVLGEVGVSMMLGGNIAGYTRNLTTAIALETSRGRFEFAFALGFVLLGLSLGVNLLVRALRGRRRDAQ